MNADGSDSCVFACDTWTARASDIPSVGGRSASAAVDRQSGSSVCVTGNIQREVNVYSIIRREQAHLTIQGCINLGDLDVD